METLNMEVGLLEIIKLNFDIPYIIVINILTYLIIKTIIYYNKGDIAIIYKRSILVFSIILISILYVNFGYNNYIKLLNSAIASPVFWSWLIKPIMNKINIGYK